LAGGGDFFFEAIDAYGSINQASRSINISYRKAWSYIKLMEERLGIKLVERRAGGRNGGGASLTREAREFLENFKALEQGIREIVDVRFGNIFKGRQPCVRRRMKDRAVIQRRFRSGKLSDGACS